MNLFTRARAVQRALKNVGRVREIVAAMSRFGFDVIIERLRLGQYRSRELKLGEGDSKKLPIEARTRLLFENLGPTFIKVGQILAGRPDLIPEPFITEFAKLQDQVSPLPFAQIKKIIESELKRDLSQLFASVEEQPLATASIAQVHSARTLDGRDIVIKVRKPQVKQILERDLDIMEWMAEVAQNSFRELHSFRLPYLVAELKKSLLKEADFLQEAIALKRFAENFKDSDFLVIPKVYDSLSSEAVLCMEKIHGTKLQDVQSLARMGVNTSEILKKGLECFNRSIFEYGLFHADPHGGNILILPDGRMGLIDFGAAAWLSERSRRALLNMFIALIQEDYDSLVYEYILLSPADSGSRSSSRVTLIQSEVAAVFSPYRGLPLKDINAGKLLLEGTRIAFEHKIVLPQDLILVFKSIMTLEGIGRSLDPNFDLLSSANNFSKILIKEFWSVEKLTKETYGILRDVGRFAKWAPRQFSEVLRQVEDGQLQIGFELRSMERLLRTQRQASTKVALSILVAALLAAATAARISQAFALWMELSLWGATACLFLLLLQYVLFPPRNR
jgi:ubiquinone biosynthesis protein